MQVSIQNPGLRRVLKSLEVIYLRRAEDTIVKYEADAAINGLTFDRQEEVKAREAFTKDIGIAVKVFMENPIGTPLIFQTGTG
jgi:glucosyl-3-phosphoglycerate synthase